MERLDNTGTNKEINESEKEKSAESFKIKLRFLTSQISDVVDRLEKDLKTNYEDLEKQIGQRELEEKIEKNTGLIKLLYGVLKNALLGLKSERLKEANKEYMGVLESSKLSAAEKETAGQDYLRRLEKLVSDEDFELANQRVLQGNLYNLYRQFDKLKPSEQVSEGRTRYVGGGTQEEAIDNIKTIQDSLRTTADQSGDITDYSLNSLAAACDVIGKLIFLYETKIEIYKQKSKEREEAEKKKGV